MVQEMNERSQFILKLLIERYINDGLPVGSRTLANQGGLTLSPASIRNVLADLEELGYLSSPHTSAGRIPTELGYRFFINSLLTVKPLQQSLIDQFELQLQATRDHQSLLETTTGLLSKMSHLVSIISVPKQETMTLRHIEFLPLSGHRVLVIIVINEQSVQNRIIATEQKYSASELEQIGNFLTQQFAGCELSAIRQTLMDEMANERQEMDKLLANAINIADLALDIEQADQDFVLRGQENLLEMAEATGISQLRSLLDAFAEKQSILNLLENCMQAEGVQIYIGDETGHQGLAACSVITAPYQLEGRTVGVLGVVGPTRMHYEQVIPLVDITAKIVSGTLK